MADVSLWVPVLTALTGIGGALGSQYVSHLLTRKREENVTATKREAELYFISTQLVFRLERFAQECAAVVQDEGEEDEQGYTRTTTIAEAFSTDDIAGDWRVLPGRMLYRIHELSVLIPEANQYISMVYEWDNPPDWQCTFRERRYQYSRLGMKAILLSKRLRKLNGMPSSYLDNDSQWSVQDVLWGEWRKQRKSRADKVRG